jgi:V-type H+-transporting ATPase subunit F
VNMAQIPATQQDGALLAMIVDQDTATGLLLTGVGHVDLRRQSNFVIVDDSECAERR